MIELKRKKISYYEKNINIRSGRMLMGMDLSKLSRKELLELMLKQSEEIDSLKMQLEECNNKLNDKMVDIEKAGDIATACLKMNSIFENAQQAASQYLYNIEKKTSIQQQQYDEKQTELEKKLQNLKDKTIAECENLKKETVEYCLAKLRTTDLKIEKRIKQLNLYEKTIDNNQLK